MKLDNRQEFNFSNVRDVQDVGNVHVHGRERPEPPTTDTLHVLLILANPKETQPLRLGEEERVIRHSLGGDGTGDVHLDVRHAARLDDIQAALQQGSYGLVQLSGHGADGSILLENPLGETQPVPVASLLSYLADYSPPIRCVFLNACAPGVKASDLAPFPAAMVMQQPVPDAAAIAFSRGFYRALRTGSTLEEAHREGSHTVRLAGFSERDAPRLFRHGA